MVREVPEITIVITSYSIHYTKLYEREVDTTRPVTAGGVLPKAGNTTGYFDVPDVMGYNYRAINYDEDHQNYPNRKIYGSENWGTFQEWKDAIDRDFVAGIFLWTGIAYMGESGPFPWKGLELSLLDFAGFYTPRITSYNVCYTKLLRMLWLIPFIVAFSMINDFGQVLSDVGTPVLMKMLIPGFLWGVGMMLWGKAIKYIGMSLGFSIFIGTIICVGSMLPWVLTGA